MKNTIFTKTIAILIVVFAMSFAAAAQTTTDADALYTKAVELGEKGDFAGAEKAARLAIKANPKFAGGYIILSGALAELERYEEAVEAVTKGLELIPKDAEGRGDIEGLLAELKAELAKTSQTKKVETVNREKTGGNIVSETSGNSPQAGLWRAKITNIEGRQDTMTFRVSANGGQIEDVVFDGYWRCDDALSSFKKGLLKKVDVNSSPGTFAVANGKFSDVKKAPYIAWTFEGVFTGATTAKGSFRVEYSTECDTYKLEWTAERVEQ
ncbi:MAG TPA: tetratricopeptide repeat protein [Pyrinomonadaceae bacterium]|nr:tetratricopeptide repeat protein [Pyrinomonadaceae bacterium]